MVGSRTENLLCMPQPPWPGSNAHAAQKGDIKFGVDPAVVVAAGLGNSPPTFQVPKVFGTDA